MKKKLLTIVSAMLVIVVCMTGCATRDAGGLGTLTMTDNGGANGGAGGIGTLGEPAKTSVPAPTAAVPAPTADAPIPTTELPTVTQAPEPQATPAPAASALATEPYESASISR